MRRPSVFGSLVLAVGTLAFFFTVTTLDARQRNAKHVGLRAAPLPSNALPNAIAVSPTAGRWRLLSFAKRERITLWLSHILIMHSASDPDNTPFLRPLSWRPDSESARDEGSARSLADKLSSTLKKEPQRFTELAHEYSDDVVTADSGGSLGGLRVGQLPAAFLDALEKMRPGQTSDPLRTPLGYHILMLRAPPPEDHLISGQRIVVRYAGTSGAPQSSPRTRTDALNLASSIVREARRAGTTFSSLVRKHSEHEDALRQGDMGVWSTREPNEDPLATEVLDALPLGGVSEPIDSPLGFQILKRVLPSRRALVAAEIWWLPYDNSATGRTLQEARARRRKDAKAIVASLRNQQPEIESLTARFGAPERTAFTMGRGNARVERLLPSLRVDEVSSEIIDAPDALLVVRRLDPNVVPPVPPMQYELPQQVTLDLQEVISTATGDSLATAVRGLSKDLRAELQLPPEADRVVEINLEELARLWAQTRDASQRLHQRDVARKAIASALGPTLMERADRFIAFWASRNMLHAPVL